MTERLYDVHPVTGASIEVFFVDGSLTMIRSAI
jgi:hypothetical protein